MEIPIDKLVIDPCNVRGAKGSVGDLEESIELYGVQDPATVRSREDGTYGVVAGGRRFLAAKNVGEKTLPCIIRKMDDDEAYLRSFTENIQRVNLTMKEEAEIVGDLYLAQRRKQKGQRKVAEILGKSRSWVDQRLKDLDAIHWFKEAGYPDSHPLPQDAEKLSILARAAKRLYPDDDDAGPRAAFIEGFKDKTRAEVRERIKALLSKGKLKTRSLTLSTKDLPPEVFDLLDGVASKSSVGVRKAVAKIVLDSLLVEGAITAKEHQGYFHPKLKLPRKRLRFPVRAGRQP